MAAEGGQSPLEQFVWKPIFPVEIGGVDVSFSNSSLFMTMTVVVATLFLVLGMRRSAIVPGRWQVAVELSYEFIAGLLRDTG
ncbi:MAG: F0F1 ATP synthase subunit A, partial [Pseudomonadota bacterium]|nr:F0F1 ATP synthase subunit A [Pseudomonadota bacterium]